MTAAVPLPTPSPLDIIPLESFEGLLTAAGEALAEAAPLALAEASPLAIGLGGVWVTNRLLQWKAWDHFWLGVGATLNNVWHTAAGFLFGVGAGLSADTVGQMIQLATHVSIRATRQLVGSLASKTIASINLIDHGLRWVAASLNANVTSLSHRIGQAITFARAEALSAERYADARVHAATDALAALTALEVNALRAELLRDVITPLRSEVVALGQLVRPVVVDVEGIKDLLGHNVLPNLAKALATAGLAATLAHAVTTWVDDCGEPMCQNVGPKTDWGKLFHRFEPAALWALLAAVGAISPGEIERASEDFARLIGPPLARWAEGWLGLRPEDVGGAAQEVGHDVGKLPFVP